MPSDRGEVGGRKTKEKEEGGKNKKRRGMSGDEADEIDR
jgi:hypothetical protein